MRGKLIVLEGLDGSGKATQTKLLCDDLGGQIKVLPISFPDYSQPSSMLVKMYLDSEFGDAPSDVNPYAASSFYAVDRYASYKKFWEKDYNNGDCVIADRYVTSNAIYQMSKLPKEDWDDFLEWMQSYEYEKLQLPVPDLVAFLDMPIEVSQKLMSSRYNGDETKKDLHESNIQFLKRCREAAFYSAKKLGWKMIACTENGQVKQIAAIHKEVLSAVKKVVF